MDTIKLCHRIMQNSYVLKSLAIDNAVRESIGREVGEPRHH